MKKIVISLTMILFAGALATPAYASLGFIKPESKIYFIQPALESIRLFFTFSKEAKVDYLIDLADRRTEEINTVPSNETANRYAKHFRQLGKIAEETPEDDKNRIVEKITEISLRQQEVLAKIYNQVPEQAKESILNAQENSAKHMEETIEAIEGAERAKEYKDEAAKIQQIGKLGQIEKLERIRQAPMEGAPQANPSESVPQELRESKGLLPGKELNPLNPLLDEQNGNDGERMEPAAPVPIEQPAPRQ